MKMASDIFEKISTLVFLDLEATGLPSEIKKNDVRITELSLVAVDRAEFESNNSMRVLNKLNLCFQPGAPISPPAMNITGLFNDSLENQEPFDDSIPKIFEYFFRRLRMPICILAHNGKKYDFPLLQAELSRVNYALNPNILCADTLEALKSIAFKLNKAVSKPISLHTNVKAVQGAENPSNIDILDQLINEDEEIEKLLSIDLHLFENITEPLEYMPTKSHYVTNVNTPKSSALGKFKNRAEDERTPPKYPDIQVSELIKPKKVKSDPQITPYNKSCMTLNDMQPQAKRKLFYDNSAVQDGPPSKVSRAKITSFSLEKLYFLFFGEKPPMSHYAEDDCIALSKVCQVVHREFLPWIDEHNVSFSSIKPMWT